MAGIGPNLPTLLASGRVGGEYERLLLASTVIGAREGPMVLARIKRLLEGAWHHRL